MSWGQEVLGFFYTHWQISHHSIWRWHGLVWSGELPGTVSYIQYIQGCFTAMKSSERRALGKNNECHAVHLQTEWQSSKKPSWGFLAPSQCCEWLLSVFIVVSINHLLARRSVTGRFLGSQSRFPEKRHFQLSRSHPWLKHGSLAHSRFCGPAWWGLRSRYRYGWIGSSLQKQTQKFLMVTVCFYSFLQNVAQSFTLNGQEIKVNSAILTNQKPCNAFTSVSS